VLVKEEYNEDLPRADVTIRADATIRDGTEGTYRHQGLAWLEAAKVLNESGNAAGLGPFYYLVSHSFELFTKAFLLWRGVTHEELRSKKLSHNFKALVNRANELGLGLEEEFCPLVEALQSINEQHRTRYAQLGFFTMGDIRYVMPDNMLIWVQKYYDKIFGIIHKEKQEKTND
jgi:hypothetical protein